MNIASVIITFNRLAFLKEILSAVKSQTRKPDIIIVVNNSSSDGTTEWLAAQEGIQVITQPNVGSSGGQFTGIKAAYDSGADWIWTMDDDVVPASSCLEELIEPKGNDIVRAPLRYDNTGKPFLNDTISFNLSFPFKSMWTRIISKEDLKKEFIKAEGITFEGPLFHRSLVEKIGLPEKKFFIYGDDSDYFIRANKAGYTTGIVTAARLDRKLYAPDLEKEFSWKHYYIVRNIIAIDVLNSSPLVRLLRPWGYLISWYRKAKTKEDKKAVLKAFKDGYFYKSENER